MMVRKPAKEVDENPTMGLPYPVAQVSPEWTGTEATAFSRGALPCLPTPEDQDDRDSMSGQSAKNVWADVGSPNKTHEFPNSLGDLEQGSENSREINAQERGLPPSLTVGQKVLTPKSSFDSQRSAASEMMLFEPITPSQISQPSYPPKLSSNNPWASATSSPPRNTKPSITVPPSESLLESDAFTKPWFDFPASPAQPAPPATDINARPFDEKGTSSFDVYGETQQDNQGLKRAADQPSDGDNLGKSLIYDGPELQELEGTSPWGADELDKPLSRLPARNIDFAPELPPRRSMDEDNNPPAKPPRPSLGKPLASSIAQSSLAPERTTSAQLNAEAQNIAAKQRNQTYQIRVVNWLDTSSSGKTRVSPIMVQNANGPCPLLALVNALTLSTPADLSTALVETLRVREQITLGLLLDAVIDELMSGRRGHNLPDVSELYAFLINLHTGMNVNPSFVSTEEMETGGLIDAPIMESPSNASDFRKPGGFENTKEMRLYSTFGVPLIHGWITPRHQPTFASLKRSARTYEEAQNLMFREEELEDKLQRDGLYEDEQLMLADIFSIKHFLSSSATQLTEYGLETMRRGLGPGSIAILFRNDHFSTLYRHPYSGQLFTLVTDMGYAGHAEVVWESLTDVSGEGCEFFAGDFRPVGYTSTPSSNAAHQLDETGWKTVSRSNDNHSGTRQPSQPGNQPSSGSLNSFSLLSLDKPPKSISTEQEDHDLALALQLQEEEEDFHRRAAAARRREEDELSQAFLASNPPNSRSTSISNRRSTAGRRIQEVRSLIPPRAAAADVPAQPPRPKPANPEDGEDAPPPTYEQAASGPAYHPPPDHPAHPYQSPNTNSPTRPPQRGSESNQSAYAQNMAALGQSSRTQRASAATGMQALGGSDGSRRRGSSARHSATAGGRGGAGGRAAAVSSLNEEDRNNCIVM